MASAAITGILEGLRNVFRWRMEDKERRIEEQRAEKKRGEEEERKKKTELSKLRLNYYFENPEQIRPGGFEEEFEKETGLDVDTILKAREEDRKTAAAQAERDFQQKMLLTGKWDEAPVNPFIKAGTDMFGLNAPSGGLKRYEPPMGPEYPGKIQYKPGAYMKDETYVPPLPTYEGAVPEGMGFDPLRGDRGGLIKLPEEEKTLERIKEEALAKDTRSEAEKGAADKMAKFQAELYEMIGQPPSTTAPLTAPTAPTGGAGTAAPGGVPIYPPGGFTGGGGGIGGLKPKGVTLGKGGASISFGFPEDKTPEQIAKEEEERIKRLLDIKKLMAETTEKAEKKKTEKKETVKGYEARRAVLTKLADRAKGMEAVELNATEAQALREATGSDIYKGKKTDGYGDITQHGTEITAAEVTRILNADKKEAYPKSEYGVQEVAELSKGEKAGVKEWRDNKKKKYIDMINFMEKKSGKKVPMAKKRAFKKYWNSIK